MHRRLSRLPSSRCIGKPHHWLSLGYWFLEGRSNRRIKRHRTLEPRPPLGPICAWITSFFKVPTTTISNCLRIPPKIALGWPW